MISPTSNLDLPSQPVLLLADRKATWPVLNPNNAHTKPMVNLGLKPGSDEQLLVRPLETSDEFLAKYFLGIYTDPGDSEPEHPFNFVNHVQCTLNDKVYAYYPTKRDNLERAVKNYYNSHKSELPTNEEINFEQTARNPQHLEIKRLLANHIADFFAMSDTPAHFMDRYGTGIFFQRIWNAGAKYGVVELNDPNPNHKILPSRELISKYILRKEIKARKIIEQKVKWAVENDRFHGTIDGVSKEGDLTSCVVATGHWYGPDNTRKSVVLANHAFKDLVKSEDLKQAVEIDDIPDDVSMSMSESEEESI